MEKISFEQLFYENNDRLVNKWTCYFNVYDRYFEKYRGKELVILEIGVSQGGSLSMWKKYFGEGAKIYGIDINPKCKELEEEGITIFIGSQEDRNFLKTVKTQIPKIDILLDDGGHTMKQQIVTFEEMFSHVKGDGVYICEDCHTSYWPVYGGGYLRRGTFIEYSKKLIDKLNAWHYNKMNVDDFTRTVKSISFYDSMVVFEKCTMEEPKSISTGNDSFEVSQNAVTIGDKISFTIEKILAFLRISSYKR